MKLVLLFLLVSLNCYSNQTTEWKLDTQSYRLGGMGAFAEMVAADVKLMALSAPMTAAEIDLILPHAQEVVERNGAELYREADFMVTDLFPASVTDGKEVLVIYKGDVKERYLQVKADKKKLIETNQYSGDARKQIAWRMGKLLSYSDEKIENLLNNIVNQK